MTRMTLIACVFLVILTGCAPAPVEPARSWAAGCERYHNIFARELAQHERLAQVLDVPMLYALSYQESGCQTREEFHADLLARGSDNPTWQGGIMQVDACWRWDTGFNCSTVEKQIAYGVAALADSYDQVADRIDKDNVTLTAEQRRSLFLFGYNRGGYTAQDAIDVYAHLQRGENVPGLQKASNITIFVECIEKDVCLGDGTAIDITADLLLFENDLDRAMLIACKQRFGTMTGPQGDYCTAPGYGVRYPKAIEAIAAS